MCKKIGTEGFDAAVCGCCGRVSGCFSAHHIYTYTHTHSVPHVFRGVVQCSTAHSRRATDGTW